MCHCNNNLTCRSVSRLHVRKMPGSGSGQGGGGSLCSPWPRCGSSVRSRTKFTCHSSTHSSVSGGQEEQEERRRRMGQERLECCERGAFRLLAHSHSGSTHQRAFLRRHILVETQEFRRPWIRSNLAVVRDRAELPENEKTQRSRVLMKLL